MKENPNKMDAPLRQKVALLEQTKSAEAVRIIGKCADTIDEQMKTQLRQSGIELGTVNGAIFTASATADQVRTLTRLPGIEQLQLSVERDSRLP